MKRQEINGCNVVADAKTMVKLSVDSTSRGIRNLSIEVTKFTMELEPAKRGMNQNDRYIDLYSEYFPDEKETPDGLEVRVSTVLWIPSSLSDYMLKVNAKCDVRAVYEKNGEIHTVINDGDLLTGYGLEYILSILRYQELGDFGVCISSVEFPTSIEELRSDENIHYNQLPSKFMIG